MPSKVEEIKLKQINPIKFFDWEQQPREQWIVLQSSWKKKVWLFWSKGENAKAKCGKQPFFKEVMAYFSIFYILMTPVRTNALIWAWIKIFLSDLLQNSKWVAKITFCFAKNKILVKFKIMKFPINCSHLIKIYLLNERTQDHIWIDCPYYNL